MLDRMREYGMEPVLQGFYGMVPNSMITKFPNADIRDAGKWITYQRPAFLVPSDPLFAKVAEIFYEEQRNYLENLGTMVEILFMKEAIQKE